MPSSAASSAMPRRSRFQSLRPSISTATRLARSAASGAGSTTVSAGADRGGAPASTSSSTPRATPCTRTNASTRSSVSPPMRTSTGAPAAPKTSSELARATKTAVRAPMNAMRALRRASTRSARQCIAATTHAARRSTSAAPRHNIMIAAANAGSEPRGPRPNRPQSAAAPVTASVPMTARCATPGRNPSRKSICASTQASAGVARHQALKANTGRNPRPATPPRAEAMQKAAMPPTTSAA